VADSVDTIASATGIPRADLLATWERVKANHARLDACRRHDFARIDPHTPMVGKYRCRECGGEADGSSVFWYQKGLEHGAQ
jgi:hypothetical protein